MADIYNGYQFITPVVGESNYFDIIGRCYASPDAHIAGDCSFIDVKLLLDNNNPYDSQAVTVISPYGVIGHLSRSHARLYRQDYDETILSVRAKIYSKGRVGKIFGVWVDLDYAENDKPKHNQQSTQQTKKAKATKISENTNKKGFLARLFGL